MKLITYIYVFALYIMCSPGFFIKSKMNIMTYIAHGLLFSVLLYNTFSLVNGDKESFEQATLSMKGIDHLVNLIDSHKQQNQTNIDIQNEVKGTEDASAKCWTALGKTQKDIETLRLQLDSYDGSIENIDKLNATVIDYKDKILTLQHQKEAYQGDQNSLDNLTKQFNTYKDQLESLQKQMLAFDGTDDSLKKLNAELEKMEKQEDLLRIDSATCNRNTPILTTEMNTLQQTFNNNVKTISNQELQLQNRSYC